MVGAKMSVVIGPQKLGNNGGSGFLRVDPYLRNRT